MPVVERFGDHRTRRLNLFRSSGHKDGATGKARHHLPNLLPQDRSRHLREVKIDDHRIARTLNGFAIKKNGAVSI